MLRFIEQLFCFHKRILKVDGNRFYTECRKCGKQSRGIITGGFPTFKEAGNS